MRHSRWRERLDDYADGLLSAADAARVERHLGRCDSCRSELDELRRTLDLLHGLPRTEPRPGFEGRVRARIDDPAEAPGRAPEWLRSWLPPVVAASAGLAVLALVQDVNVSVGWPAGEVPVISAAASVPASASAVPAASLRASRSGPIPARPTALFEPAPSRPAAVSAAVIARAGTPVTRVQDASTGPQSPASLSACLDPNQRDACMRFQHWLLDLGMRDANAFIDEIHRLPEPARPGVVRDLRALAWQSGAQAELVRQLRETPDPRGQNMARELAVFSGR